MIIGVLQEQSPESRVSLVPEVVQALVKGQNTVLVEQNAGIRASFPDELYQSAGAQILSREEVLRQSELLLSIHAENVPADLSSGKIILGHYQFLSNTAWLQQMAARNITIFSLDALPRTTRAQAMDILSSQANIAGYKAVLLAAYEYPRYFPMFMTAAGSIPPAKVLILGAGVAGLQAIATARRLGAVVEVFDTRPAVKEEVQSLGAKFVEVEGAADASKAGGYAVEQSEEFQQKQRARIHEAAKKADVIITTAQIPGRKAPILITKEMIHDMRPGSLIIDLAASTGGNTDLTRNNTTVQEAGVRIIGNSALAATAPADASKVYAKNVFNFLKLMLNSEGQFNINMSDDLVAGTLIAQDGKVVHERVLSQLSTV